MQIAKGFWSYVHKDDEAEKGRILQLAHDIQREYELVTGDEIDLFVDKDNLEWGDDWQDGIDHSLALTAYFIPVITPRFFKSIECRRELRLFTEQATKLGVQDLVMPILYVNVPELRLSDSGDETMELVRKYQWKDWTQTRFCDPSSPEYRRAVAEIAESLANRNRKLDEEGVSATTTAPRQTKPGHSSQKAHDSEEDTPGTIDLILKAGETMPEWNKTTEAVTEEIQKIGAIFEDGQKKIGILNKRRANYTEYMGAFKQIANTLAKPASTIQVLGSKFSSQLYDLDLGMRVMIPQMKSQPAAEQAQNKDFFDSLQTLGDSVDTGLGSLETMLKNMEPIEAMSRDLRKPLKDIRKGLTLILEGREIIKEWVNLANGEQGA